MTQTTKQDSVQWPEIVPTEVKLEGEIIYIRTEENGELKLCRTKDLLEYDIQEIESKFEKEKNMKVKLQQQQLNALKGIKDSIRSCYAEEDKYKVDKNISPDDMTVSFVVPFQELGTGSKMYNYPVLEIDVESEKAEEIKEKTGKDPRKLDSSRLYASSPYDDIEAGKLYIRSDKPLDNKIDHDLLSVLIRISFIGLIFYFLSRELLNPSISDVFLIPGMLFFGYLLYSYIRTEERYKLIAERNDDILS